MAYRSVQEEGDQTQTSPARLRTTAGWAWTGLKAVRSRAEPPEVIRSRRLVRTKNIRAWVSRSIATWPNSLSRATCMARRTARRVGPRLLKPPRSREPMWSGLDHEKRKPQGGVLATHLPGLCLDGQGLLLVDVLVHELVFIQPDGQGQRAHDLLPLGILQVAADLEVSQSRPLRQRVVTLGTVFRVFLGAVIELQPRQRPRVDGIDPVNAADFHVQRLRARHQLNDVGGAELRAIHADVDLLLQPGALQRHLEAL